MIVLDNFFADSIPPIFSRPILTTCLLFFFTGAVGENERVLLLCDPLAVGPSFFILHDTLTRRLYSALSDDHLIREKNHLVSSGFEYFRYTLLTCLSTASC